MAAVRNVRIAGTPIPDFISARLRITNPVDGLGRRQGRTHPAWIELVREETDSGSMALFHHASNGDGRSTLIDVVEYEVVNPNFGIAYSVRAERVFAASYQLANPDTTGTPPGQPALMPTSRITFFAGRVEVTAGGKTVEFDLADFDSAD